MRARRKTAQLRHGTTSAYGRGGCRCDDCKAAKAAARTPRSQRSVYRYRWPLQPLLDAVGGTAGPVAPLVLARRLGFSSQAGEKAAAEGLSDTQADHWATKAGYHPASVWGWDPWAAAGLDPYRVGSVLDEALEVVAELRAAGADPRRVDVVARLRARGHAFTSERAVAMWDAVRAALGATADRDGEAAA